MESFKTLARGKRLAIFLDYDGTLTPIVKDPDRAFMSDESRASVKLLASQVPTAIISGRCLEKVVGFVQLEELFYAGSHGLDIRGPDSGPFALKGGTVCAYQPAAEYTTLMSTVRDSLLEKVPSIDGCAVEDNKFSVSVHYRNVDPKDWDAVEKLVRSTVAEYDERLRITQGRKVHEVRPNVGWDKGKALSYLLEVLELANSPDCLPIYIGDDRTDEDAFKVLKERDSGFGILVSTKPRETDASYHLTEPSQVIEFLQKVGELIKETSA
ncbi:hypothetical protein CYMTET_7365 [Cymbomonas tetramitiformis]|uniref:Trehalose 6-phosphate phosphatase n=1 Tax=Cymbomonas tetramitiformis TaxID=36881 RepID=A0AAE0GVM3_9CHLO|nr:hypothetical protein CYMTET_7365 [Cymbomonas tetramitiformis]